MSVHNTQRSWSVSLLSMKIGDMTQTELRRALKATEGLLGPEAPEVQMLRRELFRRRGKRLLAARADLFHHLVRDGIIE